MFFMASELMFFLMSFVPIMILVVFVGSGCCSSWCTRCSVVYMVLGAFS